MTSVLNRRRVGRGVIVRPVFVLNNKGTGAVRKAAGLSLARVGERATPGKTLYRRRSLSKNITAGAPQRAAVVSNLS